MSEAQKKLPHNTKAHNRMFPYALEHSGKLLGTYQNLQTALAIAKSLEGFWRIRGLDDQILAESG